MKPNHSAVGQANGKIILMGEHAVVYGEPAVALPFPATKTSVRVTEKVGKSSLECDFYSGLLETMPELLESLKKAIDLSLDALEQENTCLQITITSTIPAERGMGSSAAVSVATVRALFNYFNQELTQEQLLKIVGISEQIAHGNPSGLDALMTSSEEPFYYQKNQTPVPIPLNIAGVLVVADTGITGQTREAVHSISEKVNGPNGQHYVEKIIELGKLAKETRCFIETNQLTKIGLAMTRSHQLLTELDVSNQTLNLLVETALSHHALGAKLTGGGRGGCMIALAKTAADAKIIEKSLINAGAKSTWLYEMRVKNG